MADPISFRDTRSFILFKSTSPPNEWKKALQTPFYKHDEFWNMVLNKMAPLNYLQEYDDGTLLIICEEEISFLRDTPPFQGKCAKYNRESFVCQLRKYLNNYSKEHNLNKMECVDLQHRKHKDLLDNLYHRHYSSPGIDYSQMLLFTNHSLFYLLENPKPPDIENNSRGCTTL